MTLTVNIINQSPASRERIIKSGGEGEDDSDDDNLLFQPTYYSSSSSSDDELEQWIYQNPNQYMLEYLILMYATLILNLKKI